MFIFPALGRFPNFLLHRHKRKWGGISLKRGLLLRGQWTWRRHYFASSLPILTSKNPQPFKLSTLQLYPEAPFGWMGHIWQVVLTTSSDGGDTFCYAAAAYVSPCPLPNRRSDWEGGMAQLPLLFFFYCPPTASVNLYISHPSKYPYSFSTDYLNIDRCDSSFPTFRHKKKKVMALHILWYLCILKFFILKWDFRYTAKYMNITYSVYKPIYVSKYL